MSAFFEALAGIVTATAAQATARTMRRLVWTVVAGLFILIGIAFTAGAGYDALVIAYGPIAAKLVSAAFFLVIGLIVFIAISIKDAQRRRRAKASSESSAAAIAFALGLVGGLGRKKR